MSDNEFISELEETKRGMLIVEVLGLKRSREYPDRVDTAWGNKTMIGLYRTMKRIVEGGA